MDDLLTDEIDYLQRSGRCERCGHLVALHNFHCCTFCLVNSCDCDYDPE